MERERNRANFLTSLRELLESSSAIFSISQQNPIYFAGESIGLILDRILPYMDDLGDLKNINIMVPSVLSTGLFSRRKAHESGASIRVTNFAVHDIIAGGGKVILISIYSDKVLDPYILAIESEEADVYEKAISYLEMLWESAHPITYNT